MAEQAKPTRRVRVAVTGLSVSRPMLRFYRDSPDTALVLVHDLDPARARAVADECPGARWTTGFAEVLASEADVVDVSTPNHVHAEQAIAALAAGKHVLCQKPMARTVDECRRMCAAATAARRTLGVLMISLSQPLYHDLRAVLRAGAIGRVAMARSRCAHRLLYLQGTRDHWRAQAGNVGGGSFIQLAIHHLNLLQWLLDDEVVRVSGMAKNLHCAHVLDGDDVAVAVCELARGPLLTLESGYSSAGADLEIHGTDGSIALHGERLEITARAPFAGETFAYPAAGRAPGEACAYPALPWRDDLPHDDPRIQQLAFARAVRDGLPAPVPGEVGLRDVAIVRAFYRAAETGRAVEVAELLAEPPGAAPTGSVHAAPDTPSSPRSAAAR